MAWTPDNFDDFKSLFLQGFTDFDLASLLKATPDQIGKFIYQAYKDETLPRRGTFDVDASMIPSTGQASQIDDLALKVLAKLKKSKSAVDVVVLANEFDVSPNKVYKALEALKMEHYTVDADNGVAKFAVPPRKETEFNLEAEYLGGTETIRFGVISDNHYCSKYARHDVVEGMYELYKQEGIETVFHCGNWIDGEKFFNKNDIHVFGLGNQVKFFIENYPQVEGLTTYFITGDDHEGWYYQSQGIDPGEYMEGMAANHYGRNDLKYLGYMEHDVVYKAPEGQTTIKLMHPGGGSAYALSYKPQKITESINTIHRPDVLLMGHYHKAEYIFYGGTHIIQAGCGMDQSPFMRKNHISCHLGGWIVEATQAPNGAITRIKPEWISFDREHWFHKT